VRIGLLSDIHGNLAGLRAVAAALDREGALDQVVVAGDLLGGPRPVEVWRELRERGWTLVRGNDDEEIASEQIIADHTPPGYAGAVRALHGWMRAHLDAATLAALGALPLQVRVPTPAGDLVVVHSSPRSVWDQYATPHATAAEVAAAYGGTGAGAIAFGHWHQSFVRPAPFALLLNVASVSLPRDRQPLSAYTILTASPGGWLVEQRRVPYDPAEETAAAAAASFPRWERDP
jgi:predicted phosphodiesterase